MGGVEPNMKTKNVLIGIVLVLVVFIFLGGTAYGLAQLSTNVEVVIEDDAVASVSESQYDWGTIRMYDGMATKVFKVKNTGSKTLKLYNATTSCACTTVQVKTATQQTPALNMHGKSNVVIEIAPGEEAAVEVVFNPAYHGPSGVGAISRVASMKTNDPQQPELKFNLTAVVEQ